MERRALLLADVQDPKDSWSHLELNVGCRFMRLGPKKPGKTANTQNSPLSPSRTPPGK